MAGAVDVVIRHGSIIDGLGAPAVRGDIAIDGDRIVAVGPGLSADAREVVDADGLAVAPGFIDLHAHADLGLLADGRWQSSLDQGVTTLVIGQDGLGLAPLNDRAVAIRRELRGINGDPDVVSWTWRTFAEYLARMEGRIGPNVAAMVPHGTIRLVVMGEDDRPPTESELVEMQALVMRSMQQGAFGLSAGLTYAPATFADDEELVALCREIAPFGGFYQPHHRNYGEWAIREFAASIEIGRRAGVPVHLTHAHLSFPVNAGRAHELLSLVDEARAAGHDVTLDSYPYLAGATYLGAFLPSWAQVGGPDGVVARLGDPAARARIAGEMVRGCDGLQGIPVDWSLITVAGVDSPAMSAVVGKSIDELAAAWGTSAFDAFCRLLVDDRMGTMALLTVGHEDNVRAIMAHPMHMPASDGIVIGQRPHPRAWGTFARFLGVYVRELGLVPLEEMVRKMTSAPARRLGLVDRGVLQRGMAADIVVFDPRTIIDRATYAEPKRPPEGVDAVLVNGAFVRRDGRSLDPRSGRVLRR
ncbi:MAG TPA: D-aminoacylase [Candidatus Limnocylindria bacterium]|nr:D-aminoacylase [Candidatus Limnocylindria bacterium]